MSEDRKIGDLPASDAELNAEASGGSGERGGGQPSPEATQPSPDATQPSPEAWIPLPNTGQPSPGGSDAQRTSPPPPDPENVRGTHPGEPFDPQ